MAKSIWIWLQFKKSNLMKWGLIIMRLALFALAVIKGIFLIEEIKNAVDLECLQV